MPLQPQVQLGADARGIEPVQRALVEAGLAQRCGDGQVTALDVLEDLTQHALALARLDQPLTQAGGGVRLDQVAVERRFGRLCDLGVRGLAGHHQEHGGEGQQLLAPQLVEQVLPVHVAVVEVVVAQHHIELPVLEDVARLAHAAGLHHGAHAEVAQLGREHAARGRVAVDHQRTAGLNIFVEVVLHRVGAVATRYRHLAGTT